MYYVCIGTYIILILRYNYEGYKYLNSVNIKIKLECRSNLLYAKGKNHKLSLLKIFIGECVSLWTLHLFAAQKKRLRKKVYALLLKPII